MQSNNIKIPGIIYLIAVFFTITSIVQREYFSEILISMIVLIILFALFYEENAPPVILAALFFQWLSITIGHFYLLFFDASPVDLLWRPAYSLARLEQSFWLSIWGLLAFSLGLKLATYNLNIQITDKSLLQKYNTFKVILLYAGFSVIFEPLTTMIRFVVPGIFQALTVLTYFKWSLFFLMVYLAYRKGEYIVLVNTIIIFEVLLGFSGYFSEFKDFMILFPIVYLSFNKITDKKQMVVLIVIAFLLINIGAVWSYVKEEYRPYLSGGQRAQVVTVSKQDALMKLWELSLGMNRAKYAAGFEAMIKRIYILEYFSATINNIPYFRPYFGGELWSKSLGHIFMPRLFFPNKEAIDDSKQTYLLTGIQVADAEKGTSISTGYMAESYADFGEVWMHLAIFILGLALGMIYRLLLTNSQNQLWAFAFIFPMFFMLNINGKSLIKIFGDSVYFLLVFYFIKRFLISFIDRHITIKY